MTITVEQTIIDTAIDTTQEVIVTEINVAELGERGFGVPSGGTTGQVLAKIDNVNFNTEWIDQTGGGGGSTPDATTTVKGKLKLAGDLSGTADLPTVVGLADKQTASQVQAIADEKIVQTVSEDDITHAPSSGTIFIEFDLVQTALNGKVEKNTPIIGATKTKITYDAKGLVTNGSDATTADIVDSTNKRYVTDAQQTVIGNTSGMNTGDNATNSQYSGLASSKEDTANKSTTTADIASTTKFPVWSAVVSYVTGLGYLLASTASSTYQVILTGTNFGTFLNGLTAKNTLVDADEVVSDDSADSSKAKKTSWLNVWNNYLKPKADALYRSLATPQTGQIIVTSGTSFTTPSTITTATVFNIELVGAGGGGGGGNTWGSGGGAGGYLFKRLIGLSPSTTYPCVIGTSGAGGTYGGNGGNGGNTTLTILGTVYTASGGAGGIGTTSSSGGAGGTGTNGDINITGKAGDDSLPTNAAILGSNGGSPAKGWGLGGVGVQSPNNGKVGTGYGAGGSGAKGTTGSPIGGNGTAGIIFCQWFN